MNRNFIVLKNKEWIFKNSKTIQQLAFSLKETAVHTEIVWSRKIMVTAMKDVNIQESTY